MNMRKITIPGVMMMVVVTAQFLGAVCGFAQDRVREYPLRDGVYINLTEDFYRALREESDKQSTTYSTDKSNEYLRQIAVSTKFVVETNLQIIKQQEQMIRLLESIDKKRK